MLSTPCLFAMWTIIGKDIFLITSLKICFNSIERIFIVGVSIYRARWLTCPDPDAEELFRMVGEVFIFWSKSHVSPSFTMVCFYVGPFLLWYVTPLLFIIEL